MANSNKFPDQFEVFNRVKRDRRNSILREGVAYSVAILSLAGLFLAMSRPLPVVVKSDNPNEPTSIVYASTDKAVRNIDARKFLHKTAKLLHGWSSSTVMTDLFEASSLMTSQWRKQFLAIVDEKIDVDPKIDSSGKAERVMVWVNDMVKNHLALDWKKTECQKADNRWHCRTKGEIETSSLLATKTHQNSVKRKVEIRASFVEVPVTEISVDGLLIEFFDLLEANS